MVLEKNNATSFSFQQMCNFYIQVNGKTAKIRESKIIVTAKTISFLPIFYYFYFWLIEWFWKFHFSSTDDFDNCCGSHVTFGDTIPASSFMRQAAGPTFYVKQGLSGRRDVTPPSRVIDFHVASIVNDSLYVELEWTAPGNNYDQGKGKFTFF